MQELVTIVEFHDFGVRFFGCGLCCGVGCSIRVEFYGRSGGLIEDKVNTTEEHTLVKKLVTFMQFGNFGIRFMHSGLYCRVGFSICVELYGMSVGLIGDKVNNTEKHTLVEKLVTFMQFGDLRMGFLNSGVGCSVSCIVAVCKCQWQH